jgi:transcriptional regulator with XRE-family HTH domain
MLKGRQFFLLRSYKNITREEISNILGVSCNDIIMYENGLKEIPEELYNLWVEAVKSIDFNKR